MHSNEATQSTSHPHPAEPQLASARSRKLFLTQPDDQAYASNSPAMPATPNPTVRVVDSRLSSAEQAAPDTSLLRLDAPAASSNISPLPIPTPLTYHTLMWPDPVPHTQLRVVPPLPSFERPDPDPVLDLTASSPIEEDAPISQGSSCSSVDDHSQGEAAKGREPSERVFVHRLYE